MKKLIAILLLFFITGISCFGANARGLIFRYGPFNVAYPIPSVTVMLRDMNGQNASSPALTGIDGMYYFYNMYPGSYYLDLYSGYVFVGRFLISIQDTMAMEEGVFSDIPAIEVK